MISNISLWLSGVFLIFCCCQPAPATTTAHWRLHELTVTELKNMMALENHLISRHAYVQTIVRRLSALTAVRRHQAARDDFLDNPLSVLVMVRRLVEDWSTLVIMAGRHYGISSIGLGSARWPHGNSLSDASRALMRAQVTYDLKTSHLANGFLNGLFVTNVSASDCYAVASVHLRHWFMSEAVEWLQEALHKISLGDGSVSSEEVVQALVPALCYKGDTDAARAMVEKLIVLYPNTKILAYLEEDYNSIKGFDCKSISKNIETSRNASMYRSLNKESFIQHKKLCQEKLQKTRGGLRCRYMHYEQPQLRFQPFKLEEIQREPPVLRFYDVITDKEVKDLMNESLPNLNFAGTKGPTGQIIYTVSRTSHNYWLPNKSSEARGSLTQRTSDMTRLNTASAENYQVARYSVAGEYLTHQDILKSLGIPFERDRIATIMFYLNDVKEGGNTVFTKWGLAVRPVKNSAILWFNYKRNGEPEAESMHSGCPILRGTKWVLNRWVQSGGQEFVMPCGLYRNSSFKNYYS